MEYFNLQKKDGNQVSCVKVIPDDPCGIVIGIHGFSSSKEGSTYQLLCRRMPAAGLGVVCIDLPGHGTQESLKETLRIPGALDSIEAAEQYVLREYPGCRIFYFASSFGDYLTGLYIRTRDHAGRRLFWRSAAVNMPALFHSEDPSPEEIRYMEKLKEQGYFDVTMEEHRPVRITEEMYNDLLENDLFEVFDADRFGKHQVFMAHGTEDQVIDPGAAGKFAEQFGIPIHWFSGEGHSIAADPANPDRVMDLAVSFYLHGDV